MEIQTSQASDIWTDKVTLDGRKLRLEPLELSHVESLAENLLARGPVPLAWHGFHSNIHTKEQLQNEFLQKAMNLRAQKSGSCFVMVVKASGEAVGLSQYMQLNRPHKSLEIGATWVSQKNQKTFVNTEAKILMLDFAFAKIGCQRVEFRADSLNFNSQRAILRLGAKYEGELRQTRLLEDGRKRDYKVYSILSSEWSNLKAHLEWQLDRYVHS